MNHQVISLRIRWEDLPIIRGGDEKGLSDEDYTALRDNLVLVDLPPLGEREKFYLHDDLIGTVDDLAVLTRFGITPHVSRVRGIFQESLRNIGVPDPEPKQQQVVNITIPNAALFSVQTLQVLENECTDYVQNWLDKGWRIVAVCPPNDCRRPTFILGHADRNPEKP